MTTSRHLIISALRGSGGAMNHLGQIVPRLLALRPEWRINLFSTAPLLQRVFGTTSAPFMRVIADESYSGRLRWEFVDLPLLCDRNPNALIYAPFGPMFNLALAPKAVWMARHIVPLLDPTEWELSDGDNLRVMMLRYLFALSARVGRKTLCVSEHARRKLAVLAGIPVEEIGVVRHGAEVGASDRTGSDLTAERIRAEPFFLHVGQPVPHRRVRELIEAYANLAQRRRDLPRLVLVGATRGVDRAYAASYRLLAEPLIAKDRVVLLDNLCHADVLTLTRQAFAIVYPSVHEDCPNALLEGLAAGRAIICADTPASRELAEQSAIFLPDPTASTISFALERLLDPAMRADLEHAAARRGHLFSWERCAELTAAALDDAYPSH